MSDKKKQIERLQAQYDQNPNSQVFAALAELYREIGQLKPAEKIAREGVKRHQRFATGILVYGRILKDLGQLDQAEIYLKKAVQLAPESILAHQICGELFLQIKKPKEALKAYKMVLFLKPNSTSARRAVNRLESLTADEYDEETFQISKLTALSDVPAKNTAESFEKASVFQAPPEPSRPLTSQERFEADFQKTEQRAIERVLSLVDAFIVRNDLQRALNLLSEAENEFNQHPEITKRQKLIQRSQNPNLSDEEEVPFNSSSAQNNYEAAKDKPIEFNRDHVAETEKVSSRQDLINSKKLYILDLLLQRVETYRHDHIRL